MTQPSFLRLPAELRLEIYRHLVTQCLEDGFASDLRGLFLSCREVHNEVEKGFVAKIWHLLRAKHEWAKTRLINAPLRMSLGSGSNFCGAITELTVALPILKTWQDRVRYDFECKDSFQRLLYILRPVFCLPWSVVTVRLDGSTSVSKDFIASIAVLVGLISWFRKLDDSGSQPIFRQVDRLILSVGNPQARVTKKHYSVVWLATRDIFRYGKDPSLFPAVRKAWVSRETDSSSQGWNMALDLKRGVKAEIKGALWEFQGTNGKWKGRRLFKSMDDVASDDEIEEDMY